MDDFLLQFFFIKFIQDKKYMTKEEDNFRFSIFKKNIELVEMHNKEYEDGNVLYAKGLMTILNEKLSYCV